MKKNKKKLCSNGKSTQTINECWYSFKIVSLASLKSNDEMRIIKEKFGFVWSSWKSLDSRFCGWSRQLRNGQLSCDLNLWRLRSTSRAVLTGAKPARKQLFWRNFASKASERASERARSLILTGWWKWVTDDPSAFFGRSRRSAGKRCDARQLLSTMKKCWNCL